MALIKCSECGNEISDKAESCPKCGNPIVQQRNINNTGVNVHTIQETSKKFKKILLLSWILMILGGVSFFSQTGSGIKPEDISVIPIYVLLVGMILYIYSKFQIWWNHK